MTVNLSQHVLEEKKIDALSILNAPHKILVIKNVKIFQNLEQCLFLHPLNCLIWMLINYLKFNQKSGKTSKTFWNENFMQKNPKIHQLILRNC